MPDKWRAAVSGGLAEGEELAEIQHLNPEGVRLLQERCIVRRVEELVADRSAPPSLVEVRPLSSDPALVVIEARPAGPGNPGASS
jgi:hypothetical protein